MDCFITAKQITMKNYLLLIACFMLGCTPKIVEEVSETTEPQTPVSMQQQEDEVLSPCPNFLDAPNPDEAETNFVLYRDFMRAGDWDRAYELWQKVYEVAPAADGRRNSVLADGIYFYEYYISQTTDTTARATLIDKIYEMYDRVDECYPEGGYVMGRKAFDYFYKYPERSTKLNTYQLFKQSMDTDGVDKAQYFILNPMASLLVDLYFDQQISLEEAKQYETMIQQRLDKGLKECKGSDCEGWSIIASYLPERFAAFERVAGFYDCDYYKEKYYQDFLDDPSNCEKVVEVYSRLKFGGCPDTDEQFAELIRIGNTNCAPKPGPGREATDLLRNARYKEAIVKFQEAADQTTDPIKKAKYILTIAKIYNAHLKNFVQSRKYALQAAEIDPQSGAPYLLIGRLYASSGPLCGSGRGWNSQVVVWPAIDAWQKARSLDSEVAAEATKFINRYRQYMPSKEDIFQRNLKEGGTFKVGCWIQRSTVIRSAPN
ncbi:MAG: hypothetical protein AAGK47_08710 [Bacteroidota bacterium]